MASERDYNAGAVAALAYIKHEVATLPIPPFARGMIPVDKEPVAAADIAKVVIDAVDADRAKQKTEQST